ncbi:MAG: phosphoadenosine phosphosulfate reductase [Yokenella regensburgei]|jgi:predicted phosphoadenosine phosphosulfate sulfurtransferase|uniref:Predicted phosphoadenosine phosphosulfate sulfotransferase n=1 Tax=Yokenella regensburgei TaxID=158877 RepID=A0AB38FQG0_9ENTR|nr:phosphoadenosine phosphosulfate reductase [Yokenella regensburgei]EHM48426.1 immunoglobulin-binding regulator A [Yokenella regensburgei ATCC 43003]KAF1370923.1 putative phosphoadenosine phosphosulfate sulfurtransferase [Yokenella regensburgei]KFD23873.1 IbrA family prophage gene co-activator [Yokenella regensburgei ATCC 49455]MDR3103158.1 phosphoadenosine phosphosulfate reductase [Yokenella regensburgei]QIU87921.1 phosphoadenosine phosphosulfate reductase [Yokenella regensburgei]
MSLYKLPLNQTVLEGSTERITWALENLPKVCVSFSGGKDSTVMLHLTALLARQLNKKIHVLFIDWEAQFSCTITHIEKMRECYADVIEKFWWVALPLTTQNALSQFQPEWQCWDPAADWVRTPPADAITGQDYFPFYHAGMTFEAFVREFAAWFAEKRPAAMLVGIRADESYNRFLAIASARKQRFADDMPWTSVAPGGHTWYVYPIYDWKTADIWTWFAKTKRSYNPLYDLMYQAGVPFRYMRICEPFGPEQRQGLWLYHVLEPERWASMCERVSGVQSGGTYAGLDNQFYGHRKLEKPQNHSWESYALFLLDSMPQKTAEHYRNKIAVYLHWYQKKGETIPDTQPGDIGSKDIPSWRRICKVMLNNDYWCRMLSFSPTKPGNYQRYSERVNKKRKEWGILCNKD